MSDYPKTVADLHANAILESLEQGFSAAKNYAAELTIEEAVCARKALFEADPNGDNRAIDVPVDILCEHLFRRAIQNADDCIIHIIEGTRARSIFIANGSEMSRLCTVKSKAHAKIAVQILEALFGKAGIKVSMHHSTDESWFEAAVNPK